MSSNHTIVLCDHIHESGLEILKNTNDINYVFAADIDKVALLDVIKDAQVAITRSSTDVDEAFLNACNIAREILWNIVKKTVSTSKAKKFVKEANEQYQNFIWDQELINKAQAESNKQCSDFITSQKDLNSQVVNKLNSSFKAPDEDKYRYKIQSLESDIDRLKSTINKLDSRLYTLERKVR